MKIDFSKLVKDKSKLDLDRLGIEFEKFRDKLENMTYQADRGKMPKTESKHVGIEIEFGSKWGYEGICLELFDSKLNKFCSLGMDGHPPHPYEGYELRVLCTEKDMRAKLKKVGAFLKKVGAIYHQSCGLHVHLDMRSRDAQTSFRNLVQSQDLIYGLAAKHRRTSQWCQPQRTTNLLVAETGKSAGINPHCKFVRPGSTYGKNTIEVRIREGVVDVKDIYCWAKLLTILADRKASGTIKDMPSLEEKVKLNAELKNYIAKRARALKAKSLLKVG